MPPFLGYMFPKFGFLHKAKKEVVPIMKLDFELKVGN
jgi:hypothetical protein